MTDVLEPTNEGPRPEDARVTREKILAATRASGGAISVDDLATALGVSTKGLLNRAKAITAAAAGFRVRHRAGRAPIPLAFEIVDKWGQPIRGGEETT